MKYCVPEKRFFFPFGPHQPLWVWLRSKIIDIYIASFFQRLHNVPIMAVIAS